MTEASVLQKKRFATKMYSWVGVILVTLIVLVSQFIIRFYPLRVDTSSGGIYSLGAGSKKVLRKLDDNLIVKVATSRNLPAPHNLTASYIQDLLVEYERASGGRIQIEYLDPAKSDKVKNEVMAAGIMPAQLNVREKDRLEMKEFFMGLAFLYQDHRESIPFVQNTQGLEYEITQRIKKLIQPEKPKIGILSSGGALTFEKEELKTVGNPARQLYEFVSLVGNEPIPGDVKAIWLIGPTEHIGANTIANLKSWVENGGTLGILADPYRVELSQFQAQPIETGVDELLASWGVAFKPGLIFDPQSDRIQVRTQQGFFQLLNTIDYPYFPLVSDLDRTNPALRDLDAISLPFVAPLHVATEITNVRVTPLARTTGASWLNPQPNAISPGLRLGRPQSAVNGPFDVGVLITVGGDKGGRVIAIGCSRFVRTDYPLRNTNYLAFINLLDWSAQDDVLLSIRSKASPFRPLKEMRDSTRLVIKIMLIVFLPLLVVVLGSVVMWQVRRRLQRLREAA